MKACLPFDHIIIRSGEEIVVDMGCMANGIVFAGSSPLRFASCIVCKGTGYVEGGPVGPKFIKTHAKGGETTSAIGHTFKLSDFSENALMAHVMAKASVFPSVGQARKNGWDKPIEVGHWLVGKRKISVTVTK